ncbi:DUF3482 domain-containing protein [Psychrobacter sp. FDAARGOS_221]|uniref:GTPase/DUF3482 domain-containing protein n=1 Tax=Psychrobacter sp. FDAARGOS_221 TaxID=1975705 RepID=UPI000BB56C4B|nr:DUF3482 domain-containing protein [Psychrobacter sp. FDAARGOS_221]PNK59645.1 DUF3482 domain-containing protein [Psychrobacter sp. FDAARGOS_221]
MSTDNKSPNPQRPAGGLFSDKAFTAEPDANRSSEVNNSETSQAPQGLQHQAASDSQHIQHADAKNMGSQQSDAQQLDNQDSRASNTQPTESNNGSKSMSDYLHSIPKTTIASGDPLKLAVVGHTNTGKTSILRTLLRDMYFGEVKNEAATTRHVERAVISDSQTDEALVALFDTPGLEDASGLMDWLEDNTASRRDGIERLQQFLASDLAKSEAQGGTSNHLDDYSQEAKVIRQLLASDMAIYVIDAREPVLGKYKDELAILSWSAIPVMPVFNFTDSQDANIEAWQTMLARRNLHISTRFDSVAFEFEDEMTLWQNLATMMTHSEILDQLVARRREDWAQLYEQAMIIISHFLLDVAGYVREIDDEDDPLPVLNEMQEAVRQSERSMQSKLMNLYKFYDNTAVVTPLQLNEYQQDPFDPELLKSYGLRTTSGAAAGALLGLGIDAAALGTTLGLGAAIGGIAGGILSNTSSIADKITGVKRLYIDPATVTLLATRSLDLLASLRHRGHAAKPDTPIAELQQTATPPWDPNKLPSELKKARGKPQWSSLTSGKSELAFELRADAAWSLSDKLKHSRQSD